MNGALVLNQDLISSLTSIFMNKFSLQIKQTDHRFSTTNETIKIRQQ